MRNSYHKFCSPGKKGGHGGELWCWLCRKALCHSHRAGLTGVNLGDPGAHRLSCGDGGVSPSSQGKVVPKSPL